MTSLTRGRRSRVRVAVVDPQTEWTRRRLQLLLAAVASVVLLVAGGGVWSAARMFSTGPETDSGEAERLDTSRVSAEDRLADEPLEAASLEAAQPGALSSGETGTLTIPGPTAVGPAAVATGFPRTPEGALAQLAAIDQAALSSASVRVAQEVIRDWAAPGGPSAQTWSGVKAVAGLLEAAGLAADGTAAITVTVDPVMGFIKGTVGGDFTVVCVDFIVTATMTAGQRAGRPQRVAVADCQRMVWQPEPESGSGDQGRWVIGPGGEPAPAPSLWPGSQASFDAGYQWLEYAS